MSTFNGILTAYQGSVKELQSMERKVRALIQDLCASSDIPVHTISGRVKTKDSLETKIKIKNKYTDLNQITDLVGIRIITMFEDQVDVVADLVAREFMVDKENSVDKRMKKFDQFGYLSLHYVVKISDARAALTEYRPFKDFSFEIQIRSILQHAWAEIEHDIGYKGVEEIPDIIRRDFARIAALLETADIEFSRLKSNLSRYRSILEREILLHPEKVDLNKESLDAFYKVNPIIDEVDKGITESVKSRLDRKIPFRLKDIKELSHLQITNILQLNHYLNSRKKDIIRFAEIFMSDHGHTNAISGKGISLSYLVYLLISEEQEPTAINHFLHLFRDERWIPYMIERLEWTNRQLKSGNEIPPYNPEDFKHAFWPKK
ncbi:GTP pyrophosphokinase [Chitinophaga sp. ARDCPP14]|uniref:GTP pyrophosphokinase n=1 Tax=Chitinophaga sp. ARDCPP14 TaxID=3391139 RepID=UPI003F5268C5